MEEEKGFDSYINSTLYYVQKTKKLVFWQTLLNQKGSDASNIFDEEIPESEQAFSDDEDEENYKRIIRKMRGM